MAKRRTKKQKKQASMRRLAGGHTVALHTKSTQPNLNKLTVSLPKSMVKSASKPSTSPVFSMDTSMLKHDLLKSLITTCILLILLFGMYWYLR